ncbi:MAG: hypothetical protein JW735_07245 [Prolixibacteraceae bacterium]|nr:hypothetical protein [Prolixibacteraceae bacterium]
MGNVSKNKQPFFDKTSIGFFLGLLIPATAFALYYYAKFSDISFMDYMASMHRYKLLFKVLSLCVLSDLPLFYLFLHFKYMKGARGVVAACFLFAFAVMGYRIFN